MHWGVNSDVTSIGHLLSSHHHNPHIITSPQCTYHMQMMDSIEEDMDGVQPAGGHYLENQSVLYQSTNPLGHGHQSPDPCEAHYRSPYSQQITMKEYYQQSTVHTRLAVQELTSSAAFKMHTQRCQRYSTQSNQYWYPVQPVLYEYLVLY